MKPLIWSLFVAVLVLNGTQARAESAEAAITGGAAVFVETYNAGDGAALAAYYTVDAALLPPGAARVDGREAIAAFWQAAMDSGLVLNGIEPQEITEMGDTALDVGTLSLSAPDGAGGMAELTAKYVVQWQRGDDGVWRLHRDMWNMNP